MKKKLIQRVLQEFKALFQAEPQHIFLSPGRINIIGEHVDYNDGFVLPAAINKYICFAVSPTKDDSCTVVAEDLKDLHTFSLFEELRPIDKMWANYILGVVQQLKERGLPIRGFKLVFSSNVPMGAGLSSSAALECGVGFALNQIFKLGLSKAEIALIGQKAEHTFVGVNCGIMDQFASVFGKKGKAIKLDCNTLEYDYHNAHFKDCTLVLLDSKVKHTHLTSGYNIRREEVEKGLSLLRQQYPQVNSFRDLNETQLVQAKVLLGDVIYRRCLFVVREIQRVRDAVVAMDQSEFAELGRLMYETHNGLSKDYEVSCEEIDFLVDAAKEERGVLGARMMGGGFGGCSINLVKKSEVKDIVRRIAAKYKAAFGIDLVCYKVRISDGTKELKKKVS